MYGAETTAMLRAADAVRRVAGQRSAMTRVLVTGGAGTIGAAVVRRLLADQPSGRCGSPTTVGRRCGCARAARSTPRDLRVAAKAHDAVDGCSHVIHLAAIVGGIANFHKLPFTLTEVNNALTGAIVHAAVNLDVERLVYVSSSMVFERATEFPTTEEHLADCLTPRSAYGFSKLSGEVYTKAAHDQLGLRYTICRPFNAYGPGEVPERDEPGIAHAVPDLIAKTLSGQRPLQIFGTGEQTRTLTHIDDIADGIVTAMVSPAAENEDFNISASRELSVAGAGAALIWDACGNDPAEFELRHLPSFEVDVRRRWPSVEKARRLLGWEAQVRPAASGLAQTVEWLRDQAPNEALSR